MDKLTLKIRHQDAVRQMREAGTSNAALDAVAQQIIAQHFSDPDNVGFRNVNALCDSLQASSVFDERLLGDVIRNAGQGCNVDELTERYRNTVAARPITNDHRAQAIAALMKEEMFESVRALPPERYADVVKRIVREYLAGDPPTRMWPLNMLGDDLEKAQDHVGRALNNALYHAIPRGASIDDLVKRARAGTL